MTNDGEFAISPEDPKVFSASFDGKIKEIGAKVVYYFETAGKFIDDKTQQVRDDLSQTLFGVNEGDIEGCQGGIFEGKCKLREVEGFK